MRCKHIDEDLIDKHREKSTFEIMTDNTKSNLKLQNMPTFPSMIIFTFKCTSCGKIRQEVIRQR